MQIASVRHRKEGSGWVHGFVRQSKLWMRAACGATRVRYPIKEVNTNGPWCDKCDTALARMSKPDKPERQLTAVDKTTIAVDEIFLDAKESEAHHDGH